MVIEEYDDWTTSAYSMMPFLVGQQLALEAVELLLKVLLHEGSVDARIGHNIAKGYECLPAKYRMVVDGFLQEAIDSSSQGKPPYDIPNAVSVQWNRTGPTDAEAEDYAAGPAQFVRYMAREWTATQSQYIGLNSKLMPAGRDVTTNGRAVAGSLVFGERLSDWCLRELFPEAAAKSKREETVYTVTHYRKNGKLTIEIDQWSDREEPERAVDHRDAEVQSVAGTIYCESAEGMLDNMLLQVGRSFDVRPSVIMGKISASPAKLGWRCLWTLFGRSVSTKSKS